MWYHKVPNFLNITLVQTLSHAKQFIVITVMLEILCDFANCYKQPYLPNISTQLHRCYLTMTAQTQHELHTCRLLYSQEAIREHDTISSEHSNESNCDHWLALLRVLFCSQAPCLLSIIDRPNLAMCIYYVTLPSLIRTYPCDPRCLM